MHCYHFSLTHISSILPPIWDQRHSNYRFQCGKRWILNSQKNKKSKECDRKRTFQFSKATIRLENPIGILGCHNTATRCDYVHDICWLLRHDSVDCSLFVFHCIKQMHQRKFKLNRPMGQKWNPSKFNETICRIHRVSLACKTVEYQSKWCLDLYSKSPSLHSFRRCFSAYACSFQPYLTVMFVWNLVTICGALLMIQTQLVKCIDWIVEYIALFHSNVNFTFSHSVTPWW